MQGRLLTQEQYDTLLAQQTHKGLLDQLEASPYSAALAWFAETPGTLAPSDLTARFDEALRRDLATTLSKLRRLASDRVRELMDALLLRWDAYNLKTLLRGKRATAPLEETLAATFPVGTLDDITLAELARAPTARAMADTLATWRHPLARPLRQELAQLGETDSLQPVEFALDRFAFTHALGVVAAGDDNNAMARRYLCLLVDRTNLFTALRYAEEREALSGSSVAQHRAIGHEPARYFLEAGCRFTRAQYEAVANARTLRHGLSLLAGSPFHWLATAVAEGEALSLPALEQRLDRALLHETFRLARRDPLGIGVVIAYIERRLNEARNLRLILRGKVLGMGAEQIEQWLIT